MRLSSSMTGRVMLKDLSDEFIHSPEAVFPQGMLVDARVLSVNDENPDYIQIALSLRSSVVLGAAAQLELSKLKEGDVVSGTVHRITDFGVFVSIDETSLIGLSRKHVAASERTADLNDVYEVGDRVKALVMGISGHKISLGLRPSLFEGEGSEEDDDSSDSEEDEDEEGEEEEGDEEDDIVLVDDEEESEDEREIQAMIRDAALGDNSDDASDQSDVDDEEEEEEDDGDSDEEEEEEEEGEEASGDEDDVGIPLPRSKKSRIEPASTISAVKSSKLSSAPESMFNTTAQVGAADSMFVDWGNSFTPAAAVAQEEDTADSSDSDEDSEAESTSKTKSRKRPNDALREEEDIRRREVQSLRRDIDESLINMSFMCRMRSLPEPTTLPLQKTLSDC